MSTAATPDKPAEPDPDDEYLLWLGKLTAIWSRLESVARIALLNLCGADMRRASILVGHIRGDSLDKALVEMAKAVLSGNDQEVTVAWAKEIRKLRPARNHWIHSTLVKQRRAGGWVDVVLVLDRSDEDPNQWAESPEFTALEIREVTRQASSLVAQFNGLPQACTTGAANLRQSPRASDGDADTLAPT